MRIFPELRNGVLSIVHFIPRKAYLHISILTISAKNVDWATIWFVAVHNASRHPCPIIPDSGVGQYGWAPNSFRILQMRHFERAQFSLNFMVVLLGYDRACDNTFSSCTGHPTLDDLSDRYQLVLQLLSLKCFPNFRWILCEGWGPARKCYR